MAVSVIALASPAFAQTAEAPTPAPIDRSGVLILVRSTLLALDVANKTGNYTAFRDISAPGFAAANNASRLADIFAGDRRDQVDLSGVAVLDPQLTRLPEIEQNGMMRMTGFFPSVPKQVNFDLLYQPVDHAWRLYGIAVNVGPSGPVPPQAAQPAPQQAATAPARKVKADASRLKHKPAATGRAEPKRDATSPQ